MAATEPGEAAPPMRVSAYGWYALLVLVLVYVINFVDRQIISILAQDIKHDLHLQDAQIGFLYGTAFAVFYALFGIPLGRLADSWYRGRLIALGLGLWSTMTALSGFASSFAMLATARIGVGIGEASASPAAYSMISDYFPKEKRATALSIYSAGLYIGGGLSLPVGGLISSRWNAAFPHAADAPLGLVGWQAAFLAVGIPGLLLALWVLTLREPQRGASDRLPQPVVQPNAWRNFGGELLAILPPLTLISVARIPGALIVNLIALAGIAAIAAGLIALTGDWAAMDRLWARRLCGLLLGAVAEAPRPAGLPADLGQSHRGHARRRGRQHLVHDLCDQPSGRRLMRSAPSTAPPPRRPISSPAAPPRRRLRRSSASAPPSPRRPASSWAESFPTCGGGAIRAGGSSSTCSP